MQNTHYIAFSYLWTCIATDQSGSGYVITRTGLEINGKRCPGLINYVFCHSTWKTWQPVLYFVYLWSLWQQNAPQSKCHQSESYSYTHIYHLCNFCCRPGTAFYDCHSLRTVAFFQQNNAGWMNVEKKSRCCQISEHFCYWTWSHACHNDGCIISNLLKLHTSTTFGCFSFVSECNIGETIWHVIFIWCKDIFSFSQKALWALFPELHE